jgi:arginase family enzyme
MGVARTTAVFCPFDLFGSAGAGAGASLLADAVREMIAENRREQVPTRAAAYQPHLRTRQLAFETLDDYRQWRKRAGQVVRQVFRREDFLLWIAGNHLGTLPVYDELARGARAAPQKTLIVQFDAHLDIHQFSDCTSELSHGNFLLHCPRPLPSIVNIGHRDLLLSPEHIQQYYAATFSTDLVAQDPAAVVRWLRRAIRKTKRVFIDIDCDVFDPGFFPAVTHPLPFGLSPSVLLHLLDACWCAQLRGVSLSEFDPGRDRNDESLNTLGWLLEYLLLKRYESTTSARRRSN